MVALKKIQHVPQKKQKNRDVMAVEEREEKTNTKNTKIVCILKGLTLLSHRIVHSYGTWQENLFLHTNDTKKEITTYSHTTFLTITAGGIYLLIALLLIHYSAS